MVLLLVGFGVRAIYQGACRVPRGPTHSHGRPGAFSPFQVDRWTVARPLLVGAVHGLAGSGALTALVVTTLPSTVTRLAYLMLFGVGSTVGMAALSGLLGWPIARLGAHHVCAHLFAGRRQCLDRARFVLGLSAHRRLVSVNALDSDRLTTGPVEEGVGRLSARAFLRGQAPSRN